MSNKKVYIYLTAIIISLFCSCSDVNPNIKLDEINSENEIDSFLCSSSNIESDLSSGNSASFAENDFETEKNSSEEIIPNYDSFYYRGTIFDTNGNKLMYSFQEDSSTAYRTANADYSLCLSNILDDNAGISGKGYFAGADSVFEDILREPNNVPANSYNGIGRSIQLTIDAEIQKNIYNILAKEEIIGSVVIMRTDGSIMAEVSCPSFDRNKYYSDESYVETLNSYEMGNRCMTVAQPGSCFKIMSEIICEKNDIISIKDDGIWEYAGTSISNWDWKKYPERYPVERSLKEAFRNSSNIYFAKAFDQIGKEEVESELRNIFLFSDEVKIECDFGNICNQLEIESGDELRRSAFGQANVRTTPVYLAALVREAVFGEMVKPFILQNVVNTIDYKDVIEDGSTPYDVIASIPQEYRDGINDCMKLAGEDLIKSGVSLPNGYSLYAKTGTAEVGDGYYMYISACVFSNNDNTAKQIGYSDYNDYSKNGSYIIILQVQNPEDFDYDYASDMTPLFNKIIDSVIKK